MCVRIIIFGSVDSPLLAFEATISKSHGTAFDFDGLAYMYREIQMIQLSISLVDTSRRKAKPV